MLLRQEGAARACREQHGQRPACTRTPAHLAIQRHIRGREASLAGFQRVFARDQHASRGRQPAARELPPDLRAGLLRASILAALKRLHVRKS